MRKLALILLLWALPAVALAIPVCDNLLPANCIKPNANGTLNDANSQASSVTSVTGSISSATNSSSFVPIAGRSFNITLSGTWVGSCQLERQLVAAGSWYPITVSAAGSVIQVEYWTIPASDQWIEPQYGVSYRIDCSSDDTGGGWVSGTVNYRFDQ